MGCKDRGLPSTSERRQRDRTDRIGAKWAYLRYQCKTLDSDTLGHVGENQLDSHGSILKSLAPTARPTCPAMLTVKRFKICLSDRRQCRPRGGYGRPISRPKLCFTQRRSSKNPTLGETYSKNLNTICEKELIVKMGPQIATQKTANNHVARALISSK